MQSSEVDKVSNEENCSFSHVDLRKCRNQLRHVEILWHYGITEDDLYVSRCKITSKLQHVFML